MSLNLGKRVKGGAPWLWQQQEDTMLATNAESAKMVIFFIVVMDDGMENGNILKHKTTITLLPSNKNNAFPGCFSSLLLICSGLKDTF
jgi:hypothetical protein